MRDQAQRTRFVRRLLVTGAAAGLLATSLMAGAPGATASAGAPADSGATASAGATADSGATSQAPVADFTYQCVLDIIMWTCSFDGSSSSGSIVSWQWRFPGAAFGQTGSGVRTSARYEVAGTYQVTLTVTVRPGRRSHAVDSVQP